MRALEGMPEVEKTSIFGMAVHAVLRRPEVDIDALSARLAEKGLPVGGGGRVMPSLEDVFLDVVEHA